MCPRIRGAAPLLSLRSAVALPRCSARKYTLLSPASHHAIFPNNSEKPAQWRNSLAFQICGYRLGHVSHPTSILSKRQMHRTLASASENLDRPLWVAKRRSHLAATVIPAKWHLCFANGDSTSIVYGRGTSLSPACLVPPGCVRRHSLAAAHCHTFVRRLPGNGDGAGEAANRLSRSHASR